MLTRPTLMVTEPMIVDICPNSPSEFIYQSNGCTMNNSKILGMKIRSIDPMTTELE